MQTEPLIQQSGRAPLTLESGRLPDFIIIGAPKCGTTTLYSYLCRHARIFMSAVKEPEFFALDDVYARGETWYRSLFAGAQHDQICGEASTSYTKWPFYSGVPARIAAMTPNIKLIYLMRHPVERAYSWYAHVMRGGVTMTFEQAIENDSTFIYPSLYIRQIEQHLAVFAKEQFLFLTLDELKASPGETLAKTQHFLGIPEQDLTSRGAILANKGGGYPVARRQLNHGIEQIRSRFPWLLRLTHIIPKHWRSRAYHMVLHSRIGRRFEEEQLRRLSPLTPETRRRLLDIFEKPTRELETFLGRKLPGWFV